MQLEEFRHLPRHWQSYFADETIVKHANNEEFLDEFNFAPSLLTLDHLGNLAYLSLYAPEKYSKQAENYLVSLGYPFINPPNDPTELLNKMPNMPAEFIKFVGADQERKSSPMPLILSVIGIFILVIWFRHVTE